MKNTSSKTHFVEVEAKFVGGEDEYRAIVAWLVGSAGFSMEDRLPVHRLHIYFDSAGVLRRGGCRLRCVLAPGEWCRYDFKAMDESCRDETLEVSIKKTSPIRINAVIEEMLCKLPDGRPRELLFEIRNSARICLVMAGEHRKAMGKRRELKIEVSSDVLVPVDSGIPLSEIEVEFQAGDRAEFNTCIERIEANLRLERSRVSKVDRAFAESDEVCARR